MTSEEAYEMDRGINGDQLPAHMPGDEVRCIVPVGHSAGFLVACEERWYVVASVTTRSASSGPTMTLVSMPWWRHITRLVGVARRRWAARQARA